MTHTHMEPNPHPVIDSIMLIIIGGLTLLGTFFIVILICLATGLYTPCP